MRYFRLVGCLAGFNKTENNTQKCTAPTVRSYNYHVKLLTQPYLNQFNSTFPPVTVNSDP